MQASSKGLRIGLAIVAVLVVAAIVVYAAGWFRGGSSENRNITPSATSSTQAPREVGDQQPGVPEVPIAEHETWPSDGQVNPDRQLTVTASNPAVKLPAALGGDLSAYWSQSLEWTPCDGAECTTVKVPLDWENPGEASLDIAVTRVSFGEAPNGPLFVNPGGPGEGGDQFARMFSKGFLPGYDIVGWDPRGTGNSTHVQCGSTEQIDAAYLNTDGTPDDDAERAALEQAWAEFAVGCREASGDLLDHISTIETTRDLDLLRFLLGGEKLNYLGVSYGTQIGATYAELFPSTVGHMVLDAAVNITDDDEVSQLDGFELALGNYAEWCATETTCPLGDSRDVVMGNINTFLKGLDQEPIAVGDLTLNQDSGLSGILTFLYGRADAYPQLTDTIVAAQNGDGSQLMTSALQLRGRNVDGWKTSGLALPAINCLDTPDEGLAKLYAEEAEERAKAPVVGANAGMMLACQYWTADSAPQLKLTGAGAAPILVIGGTGDSATPYEHAVGMAEQLESATLLTFDGPGHGAILSNNKCILTAIADYFADGTLPAEGTVCATES